MTVDSLKTGMSAARAEPLNMANVMAPMTEPARKYFFIESSPLLATGVRILLLARGMGLGCCDVSATPKIREGDAI